MFVFICMFVFVCISLRPRLKQRQSRSRRKRPQGKRPLLRQRWEHIYTYIYMYILLPRLKQRWEHIWYLSLSVCLSLSPRPLWDFCLTRVVVLVFCGTRFLSLHMTCMHPPPHMCSRTLQHLPPLQVHPTYKASSTFFTDVKFCRNCGVSSL